MSRRFLHLSLFMALILLFQLYLTSSHKSKTQDFLKNVSQSNAEAKLANQEKLKLSEVTIADLQLIPGIADDLSSQIIEKRRDVLESAKILPCRDRHRALEQLHGIAKKKAAKFGLDLELD
ncbi:MAG: hypothetical protein GYA55_09510 [SAR324 cluster bacterium]|uniref:Helix-hairpin-helix domain-containing protein n=1 Tax=SAR324 cluster bacterium TaxID=2024889 RepID=A0A7X9IKN4_9DELT|nr:hypothetical protein [SAR324 cluster bacterium]